MLVLAAAVVAPPQADAAAALSIIRHPRFADLHRRCLCPAPCNCGCPARRRRPAGRLPACESSARTFDLVLLPQGVAWRCSRERALFVVQPGVNSWKVQLFTFSTYYFE